MKSLLLLFLAFPAAASGHETRQQGPHVHGQAQVQIALDGNILDIALQAPGMGILSFERPPATSTEADQLNQATALLGSARWLHLPANASCRLDSQEVTAEGFAAGGDQHGHHDHEADDGPHHHHAGFQVQLRYRCQQPAQLDHLTLSLGTAFANLHETVVELATAKGQGRVELRGTQQRVDLPR